MNYALCYFSIPTAFSLFNRELTKENTKDMASFVRTYIKNRDATLLKVHEYLGELEVDERDDLIPTTLLIVSIELEIDFIKNWKEDTNLIFQKVYEELKNKDLNLATYSEDEEGTLIAFTKDYD